MASKLCEACGSSQSAAAVYVRGQRAPLMSVCRYGAIAGQAQLCTDCLPIRPAVHALPHVNGNAC